MTQRSIRRVLEAKMLLVTFLVRFVTGFLRALLTRIRVACAVGSIEGFTEFSIQTVYVGLAQGVPRRLGGVYDEEDGVVTEEEPLGFLWSEPHGLMAYPRSPRLGRRTLGISGSCQPATSI